MNPQLKLLPSSIGRLFNLGGKIHFTTWQSRIFAATVAVGCIVAAPQKAAAATRWETLEAIHWVENPSDSVRPGRCGELGAYQFRAATWQMHTQRPFVEAINRSCSDEVAVRHYEWLKTTLSQAGIEPTTYNIALAWNAGPTAVANGRAPSSSHDYATRVNNLAVELNSRVAMK